MLILQRRPGESLRIGEDVEITVVAIEGGKVRLALSAPKDITILRSELIGVRDTNLDSAMDHTAPAELISMLDELLPAAPTSQKNTPLSILKSKGLKKHIKNAVK